MFNLLSHASIRTRLLVSSVFTLALICLFILIYYPAMERERLTDAMHVKQNSMAETVGLAIGVGLRSGDYEAVSTALDWARRDSMLVYAIALDEDGQVFASYNPRQLQLSIPALLTRADEKVVDGLSLYTTRTQIRNREDVYGTLLCGSSLDGVNRAIDQSRNTTIVICLVILLLGASVSLFFSRMITRGLLELVHTAQEVSKGNTSVEFPTSNRDEVGQLGAVFNDMMEHIRSALVSLRRNEAKYRSIFDTAPNLIATLDHKGIIIDCNSRVNNMLGYKVEEITDQPLSIILSLSDIARIRRSLFGKDVPGYLVSHECRMRRRDGSYIDVSVNTANLTDDQGVLTRTLCIIEDISQRKYVERQQLELHQKLERSERMESIGVLAGGVAHDLNNMLGPLVAYPDMLLDELEPDHPIRHELEIMGRSAEQAASIIQDLLALARRGRYQMAPIDLNDIVANHLESLPFKRRMEANPKVTLDLLLDRNVGRIFGSVPHLTKVVMNLVVNAIDAMPDGGLLRISTSQQKIDELFGGHSNIVPGDYVILRVQDTGCGISEEDSKKIFEPYYSKKEMGNSGSGLGLAVVYGVVKDHKGYYDVFSTVNEGTEFVIYIPVSRKKTASDGFTHQLIGGRESVLVVDDVFEQRELASFILRSLGYAVTTVDGGREAIKFLNQQQVDIVVLDMIMEDDFDGLDTYRKILEIHPGQKAIIVSGFSATERVKEMTRLGAGQYVRKPYTRDSLGRAIRKELDQSAVRSIASPPTH